MTREQHIKFLKELQHSLTLCSASHVPTAKAALDKMIAHASMDPGDEKTKKRDEVYDNLRKAALEGSQFTYNPGTDKAVTVDARAEVNKIFVTRINNYLVPMATALEFFEIVSLEDNAIPYYENTTETDTRIALVGQDGGTRESRIVKHQSQTQVPLYTLASEKVKYQLMDILRGSVANEQEKLINIARDLQLSLDGRLWTSLKANTTIANFTTTGTLQNRTYVAHPSVQTDNLPSTNALSYTTDGFFGKTCLDKVFQYASKFAGLYAEDIYPTAIFMPSGAALDGLSQFSVSTTPNSLNEQIATRGFISNYLGRNFAIRGIPTLAVASKKAYIKFNKPVGFFFEKRGMDRMINKRDEETNEGSMFAKKVWGAVIPRQHNPFIAEMTYAS